MDVAVQSRDGGMRHIEAEAGQTLLEALRKGGVTMFAPCGGADTCGGCRILVHDRAGAG